MLRDDVGRRPAERGAFRPTAEPVLIGRMERPMFETGVKPSIGEAGRRFVRRLERGRFDVVHRRPRPSHRRNASTRPHQAPASVHRATMGPWMSDGRRTLLIMNRPTSCSSVARRCSKRAITRRRRSSSSARTGWSLARPRSSRRSGARTSTPANPSRREPPSSVSSSSTRPRHTRTTRWARA